MKIKLNKKFYNKRAIKDALKDFSNICKGKIINDKIEVMLSPKKKIENLKEEFCNYVLGLIKNRGLF